MNDEIAVFPIKQIVAVHAHIANGAVWHLKHSRHDSEADAVRCLSLIGKRPCKRFESIEVEYLDRSFTKRRGTFTGFTAQIIQHEIDHCNGIII